MEDQQKPLCFSCCKSAGVSVIIMLTVCLDLCADQVTGKQEVSVPSQMRNWPGVFLLDRW